MSFDSELTVDSRRVPCTRPSSPTWFFCGTPMELAACNLKCRVARRYVAIHLQMEVLSRRCDWFLLAEVRSNVRVAMTHDAAVAQDVDQREFNGAWINSSPFFSSCLRGESSAASGEGGGLTMEYRYEASSATGFVQQLACNYLPHGYWFYVTGVVPEGKEIATVDRKLMGKYGVGLSRQQRARRKLAGLANVHYLRFDRHWILAATHGHHHFFEEETAAIRDARKVPIQFSGYSISVKRGDYLRKEAADEPAAPDGRYRVRVQIAREAYRDLKAHLLDIACRRTSEQLGREFWKIPWEPYAPIRRQCLNLLRLVNERRKEAGTDPLAADVIRYRRRIVRPFGGSQSSFAVEVHSAK